MANSRDSIVDLRESASNYKEASYGYRENARVGDVGIPTPEEMAEDDLRLAESLAAPEIGHIIASLRSVGLGQYVNRPVSGIHSENVARVICENFTLRGWESSYTRNSVESSTVVVKKRTLSISR